MINSLEKDFELALSGNYSKPEILDEFQQFLGSDDYMKGVYNNPTNNPSYYYGFRSEHSSYLKDGW